MYSEPSEKRWDVIFCCSAMKREYERVLTADSASVMMRCDFSFSFLSCEPSAISEARKRKFSTWRAEI